MKHAARTRRRPLLAPHCPAAMLALLVAAPAVQAAEMVVQGEVVRVEQLSAPAAREGCGSHKPPAGAGLADLLAWDLRIGCAPAPASASAEGYRVHYTWDGRTYSRIMSHHPGDTVSLRVRID